MRVRGGVRRGAATLVFLTVLGGLAGPEATAEPRLRLDYQPPWLQVEANAVPLAGVLRAIGERVGFLVIEAGGVQPPLTVSVRGSVEQVLSELLVETSHALVYRARAKGAAEPASPIEAVVLLGAGSGGAIAKVDAARRKPDSAAPVEADDVVMAKKPDPSPATVTSETSAWLGAPAMPDDTPEITRLLRDQAVATLPPSPERESPRTLSAPAMIRQAQQNVQTLVDALMATSQALMDSVKNTGR
jgi:hypothetical protein